MMLHALLFIWAAAGGSDPATVTELRVEPVAGYTEVVVRTSDEVSYSDFLLTNPPRLIVDLKGARHALSTTRTSIGVASSGFGPANSATMWYG
jgi:hypothetical protein